mmetsp:Transcript_46728/g.108028  ORF Transcript_46728/g.108028 Transcript_46728/m.108028 type:complete len:184 (+) Transcript_46728:124-675(+)|eukprot:CAMPEP_0171093796 /NCGR_PEP_ID=MMETSP0766_2-20121228/39282_1 /TAXON_ID=439317 /ORGANISM="Gambierdiscus australes, Strain CAWD 149" /LENGTH=183 /DNA_ID=CAMNT_0011552287 /DNA_START=123 /DNA_END=674 /DNA_ORIENTATION=+
MGWKDSVASLKQFAAAPWFPIMVGLLSGANLFVLVMSGPLVVLFCSAVLANPGRWIFTASMNAVGTVMGCFMLVLLIEMRGTDFVKEAFPSTFQSRWWSWTESMMQAYGSFAAIPVSAMPIILHPLIFFAKLSNMSNAVLLGSILVGRVLKYSIMSQMALSAPQALRFFGASKEVIDTVKKAK